MAKASASIPTVVQADEAERLDYVDDKKNYYVTLQMGGKRSWRAWAGKHRQAKPLPTGGTEWVHDPVLHQSIGPFPGRIVNGLIGEHNEWVKDFTRRKEGSWSGHLDRQLLVLDTEETSDIPDELKKDFGSLNSFMGAFEAIVQQKIAETIGAGA